MNWDVVKQWWSNLADRERRMLLLCGIVLAVFLFYSLIWSPLSSLASSYQSKVQAQKKLLQYLQKASQEIQQYQAKGIHVGSAHGDLLATVEKSVSQQQLAAFMKQVEQPSHGHVELTFEKVPFDRCMQWLQEISMTDAIRVTSLSASRLPVPAGTADVKVVLE